MTEQIQNYVTALFAEAPKTRAAYDLREEIIANALDRYNDLTAQGVSPEDAYETVVNGIGDVSELLNSLSEPEQTALSTDTVRLRSARLLTIAIGLYIVAAIVLVGGELFGGNGDYNLVFALAICIAPTCMLVYRAAAYPSYIKKSETMVEDFREWREGDQQRKAIRSGISSLIWMISLIIYFLVSFFTGAWYITWVIFLIAPCIDTAVRLLMQIRR